MKMRRLLILCVVPLAFAFVRAPDALGQGEPCVPPNDPQCQTPEPPTPTPQPTPSPTSRPCIPGLNCPRTPTPRPTTTPTEEPTETVAPTSTPAGATTTPSRTSSDATPSPTATPRVTPTPTPTPAPGSPNRGLAVLGLFGSGGMIGSAAWIWRRYLS